jgi:3-hydroxyacyl-[acyl-carrier-protein] dehydratase
MHITHDTLKNILPHAYPFLLIDRVLDYTEGKELTAIKNITANEWVFNDRGAGITIFPETLIIEAAAQAAVVLYHVTLVKDSGARPLYLLGRAKAEFNEQVHIGDQMKLKVFAGKLIKNGGFSNIDVYVDKTLKAKVEIIYGIKNESEKGLR